MGCSQARSQSHSRLHSTQLESQVNSTKWLLLLLLLLLGTTTATWLLCSLKQLSLLGSSKIIYSRHQWPAPSAPASAASYQRRGPSALWRDARPSRVSEMAASSAWADSSSTHFWSSCTGGQFGLKVSVVSPSVWWWTGITFAGMCADNSSWTILWQLEDWARLWRLTSQNLGGGSIIVAE